MTETESWCIRTIVTSPDGRRLEREIELSDEPDAEILAVVKDICSEQIDEMVAKMQVLPAKDLTS